jgi:hypothetical protein
MGDKRTYEDITGYLGRISPVLEEPEALTQNIMAQIEYIARHKKNFGALRITGLLSGAAACLLLCLMMYETAQLTLLRQNAPKSAEALLTGQAGWHALNAGRSEATASVEIEKMKIADLIKEKLAERSRKEQRYTAYLRSAKTQDNLKKMIGHEN